MKSPLGKSITHAFRLRPEAVEALEGVVNKTTHIEGLLLTRRSCAQIEGDTMAEYVVDNEFSAEEIEGARLWVLDFYGAEAESAFNLSLQTAKK